MIEFNIEVLSKGLQESLKKNFEKLRNYRAPLKQAGVYMLAETDKNFRQQRSPDGRPWKKLSPITKGARRGGGGGGKPLQDTGFMKGSIFFKPQGNDRLKIFSKSKWAAFHQGLDKSGRQVREHKIKPVKKKYLAIPLKPISRTKKPREFKDAFIRKSKKGRLVIVRPRGEGLEALYLLKKEVTVPARPFLGFSKRNINDIEKIFVKWVDSILKQKGG